MSEILPTMSKRDQKIVKKMEIVLRKNKIPSWYFHLGGYAEECVCLERVSNGWVVFTGERGKRFEVTFYEDLVSACIHVLDKIAESDRQYQKMLNEYRLSLCGNTPPRKKSMPSVVYKNQQKIETIFHKAGNNSKRYKDYKANHTIVVNKQRLKK